MALVGTLAAAVPGDDRRRPAPRPIASYTFEGAWTTAVPDASGAGAPARVRNVRPRVGRAGGTALGLTGARSRVTVPHRPSLRPGRALTVAAWVRPVSASGRRTAVAKLAGAGLAYAIHAATPGGGAAVELAAGGRRHRAAVADDLPLGRWSHVALTYDGARLRLLIDGAVAAATPASGSVAGAPGPLRLGRGLGPGSAVRGSLDEVRIYAAALTPAEVRRDMRAPVLRRRAAPPASPAPAAAPAPPAAPPAAASPSGVPMPTGPVPGWREVFADDFPIDVREGTWTGCDRDTRRCSGLPPGVREKWYSYPEGYRDTSGRGRYLPAQVNSIGGSTLRLRMRHEGGVAKVAAPIPLLPAARSVRGGLRYGRYAVRFRADPVPGYKLAWLLWPQSDVTPRDGEIDFPEGDLDGTISAFMHRQDATDPSGRDQDAYVTRTSFASGWHTAVIEWAPERTRFILDDQVIGTSTARIPNTPMDFVMQSETALSGPGPAPGSVANIHVDWVKIWSLA